MEWLIYALVGVLVGVLAGLFGVGGGLVIVPVLAMIYAAQDFGIHTMQIAIGTSLATIIFTSLSSIRSHCKKQAVLWDIWWLVFVGVVLGSALGAVVVAFLPNKFLAGAFAIFEISVGLKIWFNIQSKQEREGLSIWLANVVGFAIGFVSTLVGIGGGTVSVPFLLWKKVPMRNAVATASAIGLPIAIFSTIGFVVMGVLAGDLPDNTIGFVHWPALLAICASSVLCAPLGAKLAHQLNPKLLQKSFAILLLGLGLKMLWF